MPTAFERDLQRLSQLCRARSRAQARSLVSRRSISSTRPSKPCCAPAARWFNIHGSRRANLAAYLTLHPSALSRQLKRLRLLGLLIKKVAHTYRYRLTGMGGFVIAAACLSLNSQSSPRWLLRNEFLAQFGKAELFCD